jgi:hypothetical protein
MKSITNIVNCVLNQKFVNGIVSITTDALLRMEVGILDCEGTNIRITIVLFAQSIGRDDSKLPGKIKDLFIFQLDFLIQGVFIPCMQVGTLLASYLPRTHVCNLKINLCVINRHVQHSC